MKHLLLSLTFLLFAGGLFAQTETKKSPAQKDTEALVAEYQLNDDQAAEMLKVQERKYRNLKEFEPLMNQDVKLYLRKLRALVNATDASFRRILNDEQIKTYNQKKQELRQQKAQLYKEMKAAGASQFEIDKKLVQLDLEAI
ncbi:MAG: hypothetical protein CMN32_07020 [Saprospirales bacterium]|nr:hypothetical protein [Saprospirales bacterium]